jgi:hypothetical protein
MKKEKLDLKRENNLKTLHLALLSLKIRGGRGTRAKGGEKKMTTLIPPLHLLSNFISFYLSSLAYFS